MISAQLQILLDLNNSLVTIVTTELGEKNDLQLYIASLCSLGTVPRNIAPCSAVTAVMRNPIYTAWSHRIATTNCSTAANHYCHQHLHPRYLDKENLERKSNDLGCSVLLPMTVRQLMLLLGACDRISIFFCLAVLSTRDI